MKRTVYSIDDPKSTEEFVNFWRPIRTHFRGHFRYLVRLGFGTVGNITFVVTLILNCVINRLIFGPEYMVRANAFFIAEAVLVLASYAGGMLFAQSRW